jgi:hypothetical protein
MVIETSSAVQNAEDQSGTKWVLSHVMNIFISYLSESVNIYMQVKKYEKLCERSNDLPERALTRLRADKSRFSAMVMLPHHAHATVFSRFMQEKFLEAGFVVDQVDMSSVGGPEFIIHIRSVSYYSMRGLTFHTIYLPTADGLSHNQIATLRKIAEDLENIISVRSSVADTAIDVVAY